MAIIYSPCANPTAPEQQALKAHTPQHLLMDASCPQRGARTLHCPPTTTVTIFCGCSTRWKAVLIWSAVTASTRWVQCSR